MTSQTSSSRNRFLRTGALATAVATLCLASISCSGEDAPNDSSGGTTGSGGTVSGTGGNTTSGGTTGSGGTTTTGGTTGSGGASASGGMTSTGGVASGGSGGVAATGGESSTGGAGTGGSTEPEFHVYLAVGQSNMQGAAHVPEDPPFHERVQVLQSENCPSTDGNPAGYGEWRDLFPPIVMCKEGTRPLPGGGPERPIGLGPSDSFAVAMAEASGPNVTIGIVGAAHGDTSINQHLPGCTSNCLPSWGNNINGAPVVNGTTPLFEWVVDLAKKAQEKGEIKGIIFHQGENDSGDASWPEKVNQYVTALRTELNLDPAKVPFIAGELPRTGCCASSHNPLVQQIPNVVVNGHFVSSGPMEDGTVLGDRGDQLHWSTEAVIEMGKRYAAKMLEAQAAQ